jgi:hypothetical protein
MSKKQGFDPYYDDNHVLLGWPPTPLPAAKANCGEVIFRYGGGSFHTIREVGVELGQVEPLPDRKVEDWEHVLVPAGSYRLRAPIPRSYNRSTSEQSALLVPGEYMAPAALVLAVSLCFRVTHPESPVPYNRVRCADLGPDGHPIEVCRFDPVYAVGCVGQVYLYDNSRVTVWGCYRLT